MSIQSYVQQDSPDPLQATDLATKNYLDTVTSRMGFPIHEAAKSCAGFGGTTSTSYVIVANLGTIPFHLWSARIAVDASRRSSRLTPP